MRCPVCDTTVDKHENMTGDSAPVAGDIAICMYCASVNQFDDDLNLVEFDHTELSDADQKTIQTIQDIIKQKFH